MRRSSNKRNTVAAQFNRLAGATVLGLALFSTAISQAATNTFLFNYPTRPALLADGWSFIAKNRDGTPRNTEITTTNAGAVVSYDQAAHPGVLRIPCDVGDLYGTPTPVPDAVQDINPYALANATRNSLFRNLPANWVSVRLTMTFPLQQNFQRASLMLYQDDDNFLEVALSYNTFTASAHGFPGPTMIGMYREFYGFPNTVNISSVAPSTVTLRLDREAGTDRISTYYSQDGINWSLVGQASHGLTNVQLGIVTGASDSTFPLENLPNCDLSQLQIITSATYAPPTPSLVLQPRTLVFNAIQGQASVVTQRVNVVLEPSSSPLNWTVTDNATWLSSSAAAGQTPGFCDLSVNPAGLLPGVYQAALTFTATGATNSPGTVAVTLIVNPNNRVRVATWRDARPGAMSVSVDDSSGVAFDTLNTNGLDGTYVMWHSFAPGFYPSYFQAGMELGLHSVNHACFGLHEPALRYEIEGNLAGLLASVPVSPADVISFAWPCGFTTTEEEVVASDYFLLARGYNFNQFEDSTPRDFMNLKSFNSHEHSPFPPDDFKPLVTAAIAQGKWYNMVLHGAENDDGAIQFAATNDIWVAPLGTVAKYIVQRDRTVIANYQQTASAIQFDCYRLPLAASSFRSFETAITTNDTVTLTVNTTSLQVNSVWVNGVPTAFTNKGSLLFFSAPITTNVQAVLLSATTNGASPAPGLTNLVAIVRHAPALNGRIEGSLQQLLGEALNVNSGFAMTGDLLMPGSPTVISNGLPGTAGVIVGTGAVLPAGYNVILNSGSSLRYVRTRINPVTLPTVSAPPKPTGTRTVLVVPNPPPGHVPTPLELLLNQLLGQVTVSQGFGNAATLRDLALWPNIGQVAVPPGTYGTFAAADGNGFTLGVAGATTPATYNLQNLILFPGSRVEVVGPIILKVANTVVAAGVLGTTNQSSRLQLQIASGGLLTTSGSVINGNVTTPTGTVIVNANSQILGSVKSDQLLINGTGAIRYRAP